jgi:hypothetical protein
VLVAIKLTRPGIWEDVDFFYRLQFPNSPNNWGNYTDYESPGIVAIEQDQAEELK